jgi:hypothetical protein
VRTSERPKVGTSWILLLPLFLKRYDSKRVRGWGSVNDMTGKDLGDRGQEVGTKLENESRGRSVTMATITREE